MTFSLCWGNIQVMSGEEDLLTSSSLENLSKKPGDETVTGKWNDPKH